jgi:hypothetical protein
MTPTESLRPQMDRIQRICLFVGIGASLGMLPLLFQNPDHFFRSYLFAFMYWSGLTLGSLGIFLLHNVVGGKWGVVIRKFVESGTRTLPLCAVLLIPIFFGMKSLYVWTDPAVRAHDFAVGHKNGYMNVPMFIGRAALYFAIWLFWGFRLLGWSKQQDQSWSDATFRKMKSFSAPGLVIFIVSTSYAFIDWIMSLEPDWYSTIYPWMFTVGQVLLTFAFMIALLVIFSRREPFVKILTPLHFSDLSNLMLAFTILWTYMSFAQFLIIWAENLPDEIPWYIRRFSGGWGVIAVCIALFHFALPFFLLLMRFIKRNPKLIYKLAIYMICIRILDVFWIVEPAFRQRGFEFYLTDILAPVAIGGLWLAYFVYQLKSGPLLPMLDPRLAGAPISMVEEG